MKKPDEPTSSRRAGAEQRWLCERGGAEANGSTVLRSGGASCEDANEQQTV